MQTPNLSLPNPLLTARASLSARSVPFLPCTESPDMLPVQTRAQLARAGSLCGSAQRKRGVRDADGAHAEGRESVAHALHLSRAPTFMRRISGGTIVGALDADPARLRGLRCALSPRARRSRPPRLRRLLLRLTSD